jgi:hypothetical protein
MRVLVDEEPDREVVRPLRVEDVRLALRRFRLAHVGERHRIRGKRCGEHPECQSGEVLLQRRDACGRGIARRARRRPAARRSGAPVPWLPRRPRWRGGAAAEADPAATAVNSTRSAALLRWNLIPQYCRELDEDFEFDPTRLSPRPGRPSVAVKDLTAVTRSPSASRAAVWTARVFVCARRSRKDAPREASHRCTQAKRASCSPGPAHRP